MMFGFVVGGYSDYFGFSFTASYFHETNLLNADMLCSVGITGYLTIGNMCLESSLYNQLHDRVRSVDKKCYLGSLSRFQFMKESRQKLKQKI